ncbi:hypothetical protein [Microvirga arsenatis]|uniref:Uncharacterized protein n=1 Tax=Microvirga arsenatis TaxID=2692265 RepID=A0ABW9Z5I6_9HYPH|nr:hypothetical protein [Microvirga arsenatis]NBJ13754.1 hypothetical protein [Microvirga arsenatis]NBJ27206.1 hypothetical protein [Microvirga arsenatis]
MRTDRELSTSIVVGKGWPAIVDIKHRARSAIEDWGEPPAQGTGAFDRLGGLESIEQKVGK